MCDGSSPSPAGGSESEGTPEAKEACHVYPTHPPTGIRRRTRTCRPRHDVRHGRIRAAGVALSPWFITLQYGGTNANAVNLISGLAVAGLGAFALASPRGFAGLQLGSALLGVWLIIAGPILSHKYTIADPMYWSNSWAGGVLIAVAAVGLTVVAMRRPARR